MKDRQFVTSIFRAHAGRMRVSDITPTGKPYQFTYRMDWIAHVGCMLVKSSDYWTRRLHLQTHTITMFVVWSHDSCVPYPVLCLEDGITYKPYTCAVDTTRHTKSTSRAFLGQLLCGVQSAFDMLDTMSYRSKRRYKHQLDLYAHRVRGRPLKVS